MMKVLLVDDHPLVLSALQAVIEQVGSQTSVVGVGSAADARAALADGADGFDLVLLDLALGDDDGFVVLDEFRQQYPALPVVVVSASERTSDVIRAIDSGAMGFVPKSSSHAELQEALRLVMVGAMYVPPHMLGLAFGSYARVADAAAELGAAQGGDTSAMGAAATPEPHQKLPTLAELGLTPRQAEVMGLLLQGLPNKLIARQLNVSVETVKDHVAAVLRALGVSSRTQAVLAVSQMTQGQGAFYAVKPSPLRS